MGPFRTRAGEPSRGPSRVRLRTLSRGRLTLLRPLLVRPSTGRTNRFTEPRRCLPGPSDVFQVRSGDLVEWEESVQEQVVVERYGLLQVLPGLHPPQCQLLHPGPE